MKIIIFLVTTIILADMFGLLLFDKTIIFLLATIILAILTLKKKKK